MGVIVAFRTLVCPDGSICRLFGPGWPHLLHFGRVEKLMFWHLVHSQSWGAWTASWTCSACTDNRTGLIAFAQITLYIINSHPHSKIWTYCCLFLYSNWKPSNSRCSGGPVCFHQGWIVLGPTAKDSTSGCGSPLIGPGMNTVLIQQLTGCSTEA